jgi:hypothetical protein
LTCELKLEGIPMAGFQSAHPIGTLGDIQLYKFNSGFNEEWTVHAIADYMHFNLTENFVEFSIPFEGDEELCWECMGSRFIGLVMMLDDFDIIESREFCQEPICTKSGEKIHKRDYTWKEYQ